MPNFCAIPPVDMATARVGRGNGNGWNRTHTRADQYHAGLDFVVGRGSPIIAAVAGRVVAIGSDANRSAAGGLRGYGNAVVVQTTGNVPGMPNPFYVLYAHMQSAPLVTVGQQVQAGTPLGFVGSTTNGQFAGMGPHLHFEVRRRAFPSSYDNDTIDPEILFTGLGIDWTGWHREAERKVGGTLQVRAGGPSDCRSGQVSALAGLLIPGPDPFGIFGINSDLAIVYGQFQSGQAGPGEQYIPASSLSPNYPGTTSRGTDAEPPDYEESHSHGETSSGGGGAGLALGVAAVIGLAALLKGSRGSGLRGLGGPCEDQKRLQHELREHVYTEPDDTAASMAAWDAKRARLKSAMNQAEDDCFALSKPKKRR
jgi:murein DD-endopeptidase MepM/ murein hydrolase activator NlpD